MRAALLDIYIYIYIYFLFFVCCGEEGVPDTGQTPALVDNADITTAGPWAQAEEGLV